MYYVQTWVDILLMAWDWRIKDNAETIKNSCNNTKITKNIYTWKFIIFTSLVTFETKKKRNTVTLYYYFSPSPISLHPPLFPPPSPSPSTIIPSSSLVSAAFRARSYAKNPVESIGANRMLKLWLIITFATETVLKTLVYCVALITVCSVIKRICKCSRMTNNLYNTLCG